MKSITIHNLNDQASKKLDELAKKQGQSLNKMIKKILYSALGLNNESRTNREYFQEFVGVWDSDQLKEFEQNSAEFNNIDHRDWNE